MTRTRWLLAAMPCVLSVAVWAAALARFAIDTPGGFVPLSDRPLVVAMLLVGVVLPLASAAPAWPLRWKLLLLPALYALAFVGWRLATLAVHAWVRTLTPNGEGFGAP